MIYSVKLLICVSLYFIYSEKYNYIKQLGHLLIQSWCLQDKIPNITFYGSGAKIIFMQFETIILTFVYYFSLDDID